jgi:hypothetical protein
MTSLLATLTPNPRDKLLVDPDRPKRMREKLRRLPEGTFTFAPHLGGLVKKQVHEDLVDRILAMPKEARPVELTTVGEDGKFLARFRRAV